MARTRRRAEETLDRRVVASFGPDWLTPQRWFRSKHRPLGEVRLADAADGPLPDTVLLVLEAAFADDGPEERYLVPARDDGERLTEPRDGEGVWAALAAAMLAGGETAGRAGRFGFEPTPSAERLPPGGTSEAARLAERRLDVEQSNTSIVLGDRIILKLYRLLSAGPNPEVEIGAFLTAAGFRATPALAAVATYVDEDGEPSAAAKLEELVAARGDAWGWTTGLLAIGESGRAEAASGIAEIGRLTRSLHDALASRPEAPGFPARQATAEELDAWQQAAEAQLSGALSIVTGEPRRRLEPIAGALSERLATIGQATSAQLSRIHGDLHLGQMLVTDSGFVVIDFEGEPARPLEERRAPLSPLRDVAGLLRSLDYAARTVQRAQPGSGFDPDAWLPDARAALLDGYGAVSAAERPLLEAFEVEKACYEVRYESANRPEWTWLPVAALERMAA
jgi:trehalose synthase-fused probable maltokinase